MRRHNSNPSTVSSVDWYGIWLKHPSNSSLKHARLSWKIHVHAHRLSRNWPNRPTMANRICRWPHFSGTNNSLDTEILEHYSIGLEKSSYEYIRLVHLRLRFAFLWMRPRSDVCLYQVALCVRVRVLCVRPKNVFCFLVCLECWKMCTHALSRPFWAFHHLFVVSSPLNRLSYSLHCPNRKCDYSYQMDQNNGVLMVVVKILDANRNDGEEDVAATMCHDEDGCPNESNDDDGDPAVANDVAVDVTVTLNPIFPDRIRWSWKRDRHRARYVENHARATDCTLHWKCVCSLRAGTP